MSLVANKFSTKKVMLLGALLITLLGGTSAFALGSTSTAKLSGGSSASGANINIWEGYANVSTSNSTPGEATMSSGIKKSVAILPDPTVWFKNYYSRGSFGPVRASIPDASTYYATADTVSPVGFATVKVVSLD